MIAFHTVYMVSLVSQATSALVLWLLAWSDRRSRGLFALATACTLHTAAIVLMPMWRGSNRWLPQAISGAMLPLMFFLMGKGMQRLSRQTQPTKPASIVALVATMLLIAGLAPVNRLWCIHVASVAAIIVLAWSVRVLWSVQEPALRSTMRLTASLLAALCLIFIIRLPLESVAPASSVLLALREVTMSVITLLVFSFLTVYLAESKGRQHSETRVDVLTGLCNRRALEEQAALQLRRAQRHNSPLALLMMDLDAFKSLNDTWGHGVGDRALRAVGNVLLDGNNSPDNTAARLGGEEFAVLLPGLTLNAAHLIAERLRLAVAAIRVPEGNRFVTFTVSIGVASWHVGETTWTEMLRRADEALYRAKRAGRNQVMLCNVAAGIDPSAAKDSRTRRALRSFVRTQPTPEEGTEAARDTGSRAQQPTPAEGNGHRRG